MIIAVISTFTYILFRYRLLTKYSRLAPIEAPKPASSFDLHPDSISEGESPKQDFRNYPDEFLNAFLSSIKIFGYIEQPVFHELARHLQTRKLLAGDTLFKNPEQERSFYVVVDGNVQVFVEPDHFPEQEDEWEDADSNDELKGYHLLNEVGRGGTLSSLFTILSLFAESTENDQSTLSSFSSILTESPSGNKNVNMSREASSEEWASLFPPMDADMQASPYNDSARWGQHRPVKSPLIHESHVAESDDEVEEELESVMSSSDYVGLASEGMTRPRKVSATHQRSYQSSPLAKPPMQGQKHRRHASVHPGIVARATVDTTLAVIPAEAFHRLTQKFPVSAAHIVQVILTRFQRVTLLTGHKYLGLTKELLRIHRRMSDSASLAALPAHFYTTGSLDRLRRKFTGMGRKYSSGNLADQNDLGIQMSSNHHMIPQLQSEKRKLSRSGTVQDGHSRRGSGSGIGLVDSRNDYDEEDDRHLREAVSECIYYTMGIRSAESSPESTPNMSVAQSSMSKEPLVHSSPRPVDATSNGNGIAAKPRKNTTSHSYRGLSLPVGLDSNNDSYFSTSVTANDTGKRATKTVKDKSRADGIEILYFERDAVLVKEGERNAGMFFLIDGLLDVSIQPAIAENVAPGVSKTASEISDDNPLKHGNVKANQGEKVNFSKGYRESIHDPTERYRTSRQSSESETIPQSSTPERQNKPLFSIRPGGVVGYLEALSGYPSFVTVRAATDSYVGYLSKETLESIIDKNPTVLLTLARRLVGVTSPLILHIDFALEWVQVNAGQVLYRENDVSDSIYLVLNGRLRTITESSGGEIQILAEYGQGESVGELEVLTDAPRPSTLHAIRDTELARMPKTLFNALSLEYPELSLQISRLIALRSRQLLHQALSTSVKGDRRNKVEQKSSTFPELNGRNNVNLRTVGVIPVNSSVPIADFALRLNHALHNDVSASTILLNSTTVTSVLGKYAFSRLGKLKLNSWLAEQEEKYRIVLYVADSGVTSQWTRTCIRQADCILLVGMGDVDPQIGEYERFLISMKTTARKELVLLHFDKFCVPGSTQQWLKNRMWIQAHHHIFMPMGRPSMSGDSMPHFLRARSRKGTMSTLPTLSTIKGQFEKYYSSVKVPTFGGLLKKGAGEPVSGLAGAASNDFARLGRRLCGKSVALVLGGGGARGIGHIGVIQALEEAGIPIDIIGGTSIGSFIGGLYGREMDLVSVWGRAKMFSGRVTSIWRQLLDLTYPVAAWFTGHEFNRGIWKCFMDSQIEDFWLPYFAVTTNVTFSRMEIHTTGYAWRYVRASMSLSGYIPPLCDNGNMLLDGGYIDNLPVSVAKNMGADTIIAVDVASADDTSPVYYGDSLSGWWALIQGFNPFLTYKIPSIADIQSRLAYVQSVAKLEEAKMIEGTIYVRLPVQSYGTLEFQKFDEIFRVGYEHGKRAIAQWGKEGFMPGRVAADNNTPVKHLGVKGRGGRRNSI